MRDENKIEKLFNQIEVEQEVSIEVPGKLFISGEYAILFPKQPAILIAVDQYLIATITKSKEAQQGAIQTDLSGLASLHYTINDNRYEFPAEVSQDWKYVMNAIIVVNDLLDSMNHPLLSFALSLNSNLVHESGVKLGLGSSGAVVVATIKSILQYHGLHAIDNKTIFKLAAIALMRLKSNGSLADIATITHGGWVYYQSFDREWLKERLNNDNTLAELIIEDWPDLIIENIQPPKDLSLLIGWTQSPASTEDLVGELLKKIDGNREPLEAFLKQNKASVKRLHQAFLEGNLTSVKEEISLTRQLLRLLGYLYQLNIETELLEDLNESAEKNNFASKSSGAGGGDCGIAIGTRSDSTDHLINDWKELGIINLSLKVTPTFT